MCIISFLCLALFGDIGPQVDKAFTVVFYRHIIIVWLEPGSRSPVRRIGSEPVLFGILGFKGIHVGLLGVLGNFGQLGEGHLVEGEHPVVGRSHLDF